MFNRSIAPQLTNALKKRRTCFVDKRDMSVLVVIEYLVVRPSLSRKKSPSLDFNYQSFHSIHPPSVKCPSLRFYQPFKLLRFGGIAFKKKNCEELFVSENFQMYGRVR